MSWFKYEMRETTTHKQKAYICKINIYDNILEGCWKDFQQVKQGHLFRKLTRDFEGDTSNVEKFRNFLPSKLKHLAHDIPRIKTFMTDVSKLSTRYKLISIYTSSACYGCQNDRPGQYDHMECDTGCLHSSDTCSYCENDYVE